jgi:threonine dehydrogenase-like Zn-dependent dehydrogenase
MSSGSTNPRRRVTAATLRKATPMNAPSMAPPVTTMRAFVVEQVGQGSVHEVEKPQPGPGEAVVTVRQVGVCGTDTEFFRGTQHNLEKGTATFPLRLGHEWSGVVDRVGTQVDPEWLGARVTGDTMLGCGHCHICHIGRQHLCPDRFEIGVRGGWHGALADELLVRVSALHRIPDEMSFGVGALVEPASMALRAVKAMDIVPGQRVLVWGLGCIGLLTVAFAASAGAVVHAVGRGRPGLELARQFGAAQSSAEAPEGLFAAAVAVSPVAEVPARCLTYLEPGGRLALVGLSGDPSPLESSDLVVNGITVIGLLSGSDVFAETITTLQAAKFDPSVLIGDEIPLERTAEALLPRTTTHQGGPKTHIVVSR